jgi:hypothetical protein
MKSLSVLAAFVTLFAISCERHEFDGPNGTRQLHEGHGAHASHADKAAHGDATAHGEHPVTAKEQPETPAPAH